MDVNSSDYERGLAEWRAHRLKRLSAEDGWLNIVGRWELTQPRSTVGAGKGHDIVLPSGPSDLGVLVDAGDGVVVFEPADGGGPVTLILDKKNPPRFSAGDLLLEITTMNGRQALRVRDRRLAGEAALPAIDTYPVDPDWRIVADWKPLDTPLRMAIDTVIGEPTEVTVTHVAAFAHDGARYELLPTHGTPAAPQFVIRDLTARTDTYPAARFLFGESVTESTIVLDFNKAINPPCAFSTFAVCPLPPPQNVLPFAVEAGEKKPPAHD